MNSVIQSIQKQFSTVHYLPRSRPIENQNFQSSTFPTPISPNNPQNPSTNSPIPPTIATNQPQPLEDPQLNANMIQFGRKQFSTLLSINFILLTKLSKQIPFTNAKFLLENTNIILVHPRPFLCKLVPFSRSEIGEVSAPSYILNQLKLVQEIPDGSTITIQGEEFDYIVSKLEGETHISTFYKGQFVVDVLDLSVGYLAGDRVDFVCKTDLVKLKANLDCNSDLAQNFEKELQKPLQQVADTNYQVIYEKYLVNGLPHLVCFCADGAILLTRIDLFDVIAVDYHLFDKKEVQLFVNGDELRAVEEQTWVFELPSLVFKKVE